MVGEEEAEGEGSAPPTLPAAAEAPGAETAETPAAQVLPALKQSRETASFFCSCLFVSDSLHSFHFIS